MRTPLDTVFHADPHIHVSTGGGAELGCRVALEVLALSSSPDFLEHVNRLAEKIRAGVGMLTERHGILRGLRQLGLFMGLEMDDALSGQLFCRAAFDNGLFMVYANNNKAVVQFLPPLTSFEQADEILERLDLTLTRTRALKDFFNPGRGEGG